MKKLNKTYNLRLSTETIANLEKAAKLEKKNKAKIARMGIELIIQRINRRRKAA